LSPTTTGSEPDLVRPVSLTRPDPGQQRLCVGMATYDDFDGPRLRTNRKTCPYIGRLRSIDRESYS
jgi:hypothetical protein